MMKLTIKARLILSFSLLVLSLVGLGVYSINSLNQVNQQSTVISDTWLPAMDAAHVMNTATSDYRTTELRIILAENDPQGLKEMKERLNNKVQELQQLMTGYEGGPKTMKRPPGCITCLNRSGPVICRSATKSSDWLISIKRPKRWSS
ncbi:hypothetical protein HMSSN036_32950 [Paenibacillus macerans]|nr:hypothetical protein HMSSN036_32950 [Paenibacillus macerans]